MKTVILCGGMGTRLSEETSLRPKPMVTVGGRPILWHIMNIYGAAGINEFVLALGYKGEMIKEYFLNYYALNNDFEVDLTTGQLSIERRCRRDWKVRLVDTGERTLTGSRLLRLKPHLQNQGTFLLTYGDGVSDIEIKKLLEFHKSHGKLATVMAVQPTARFGELQMDSGAKVTRFKEKPLNGAGWANGGFFVFEPGVFDYIPQNDETPLEGAPLENLTRDGQLVAYKHPGYWQCMDTIRDRELLESQWQSGEAPWKVWKDV
jgi:glucose-1-phosphate cytidylyltransferase